MWWLHINRFIWATIRRFNLLFLETSLYFSSDNKLRIVIRDDLKCNMFEVNTMTSKLLVLLESNNLKNVIYEQTRITLETETLLNIFITQAEVQHINAGVIKNTASDHLPIHTF